MNRNTELLKIVKEQHKDIAKGIYSVCTANKFVIEAALEKAVEDNSHILIESTCNQVNQFGGYTGMKPEDFRNFVMNIADKVGLGSSRVILGGDHLGPNPWKKEKATVAMKNASKMVKDYIMAGYNKIHLDTSMHLADDPGDHNKPLDSDLIAARTATLAEVSERSYRKLREEKPSAEPPIYVIGTEVPVPGGTDSSDNRIEVTSVEDFEETVSIFKKHFLKNNLNNAWQRVIATVVQPGVEFGAYDIEDYNHENALSLSKQLKEHQNLIFEAHSTDYQTPRALRELVEDGFAILKVGPALTYAMREALFDLSFIEEELIDDKQQSKLISKLEEVMINNPENWQSYYQGEKDKLKLARKYSLSDRSRYYWSVPELEEAVDRLLTNLEKFDIPLTLISQFMPEQYTRIRNGLIENKPRVLLKDRIKGVLNTYAIATNTISEVKQKKI